MPLTKVPLKLSRSVMVNKEVAPFSAATWAESDSLIVGPAISSPDSRLMRECRRDTDGSLRQIEFAPSRPSDTSLSARLKIVPLREPLMAMRRGFMGTQGYQN